MFFNPRTSNSSQVGVLGGTIGAFSCPGRGSTFWFTIPLELPEGSATADSGSGHGGVGGGYEGCLARTFSRAPPHASRIGSFDPRIMTGMAVDDRGSTASQPSGTSEQNQRPIHQGQRSSARRTSPEFFAGKPVELDEESSVDNDDVTKATQKGSFAIGSESGGGAWEVNLLASDNRRYLASGQREAVPTELPPAFADLESDEAASVLGSQVCPVGPRSREELIRCIQPAASSTSALAVDALVQVRSSSVVEV